MELEEQNDIVLEKLKQSLEKSNKVLHKKALVFARTLHSTYSQQQLSGIEGVKLYTKTIINLLINMQKNQFLSEEDVLNYETFVFLLAVCCKQLSTEVMRGKSLIEKIEKIFLFSLKADELIENYTVMKYFLVILEKLVCSRSKEELENMNDEIVKFYIDSYFKIMVATMKNSSSNNVQSQNMQKDLIKNICKILRNNADAIKFTILKSIIDYIKIKITKMYDPASQKENEHTSTILSTIPLNEAEFVLKYLSALIQFLPFDTVNDLISQVEKLIEEASNKNILMNCFLCIDVAFSTKSFALETCEKIITLLMSKNILLSDAVDNQDFKDTFIVSYIKSISQVLLSMNKLNQINSLKYFVAFLQPCQELLVDNNEFVNGSLFNALQNLINKLFSKDKIDSLFSSYYRKEKDDINIESISLEGNESKFTPDFILEKIAKSLLYCLSSRYSDNRIGYNLLLLFVEKINASSYKENIYKLNDYIMMTLSTQEENKNKKSEMLKIFIGKCLNFIPCKAVISYFPLLLLDFDIDKEDYTESSNVWLISYMDKFLKDNSLQTLQDYVEQFINTINEMEYAINKLVEAKVAEPDEMLVDDNKENDERFMIDYNDTKYIRQVKIKRYKLILTQLMSQIIKFTNFSNNYALYVSTFLKKFAGYYEKANTCYFEHLNEITFKFIYKVEIIALKHNDQATFEVLRNQEGTFFINKILNLILKGTLTKSEMQEGFNVITKYCSIAKEEYLLKMIVNMIQKFTEVFPVNDTTIFNKEKEAEVKKLIMRLEIANYIFKNINYVIPSPAQQNQIVNSENKDIKNGITESLLTFFDNYFVVCADNSNINAQNISKKLFDILMNILYKIQDLDYSFQIYQTKLVDKTVPSKTPNDKKKPIEKHAIDLISSKQKCKIYDYIISVIIKKFNLIFKPGDNVPFETIKSHFAIISDISILTKDINRKVRNDAYDIIGRVTSFLTQRGLFTQWINMVVLLLTASADIIVSGGINTVARIYWENRNEDFIFDSIYSSCDTIFELFSRENKEIIKSLFIYVRVLLYITKVNAKNPNKEKEVDIVINKVIYSTLTKMVESYQKEFKVKIRNMFKNLIINFGYEKVKQATEEKHHSLISYINKHIVKKAKEISAEEELMHGYNPNDLDDTVMMDNEENLIDEEEEYIKKEFKKLEKKIEDKDKKIIKNIENLTIYDDDVDERRRKELELAKKEEEKDKAKDERADKIEELFVKDNVELNNFFYVNPYAQQDKAQKEKELKSEKKDKDVIYDTKKGKLIVKDLEREIQEAKIAKKKKREAMLHGNSSNEPAIEKGNNLNFLMKKRVQNVYKDKDEIDYGSDDDTNSKRKKKMKGNDNTERNSGKPLGHYVKYSGDEYKSKKAKGDKLLQGKYEPFAYIQLNPKSIGTKGKKANLKVFEELMKNDNKK